MSWVRLKEDGTKVTTPTWIVIPCVLLGWAFAAALAWVVIFERGERQVGLLIATLCLGGAGVRLLYMFEKIERNDRAAFGAAQFTRDRGAAASAGLEGSE